MDDSMSSQTETEAASQLRAWAKGIYPTEAGVELLVRHGRIVYEAAPWVRRADDGSAAWIDPTSLLEDAGPLSGSEQRVVAIAASLLGGPPVDLSEVLSSLDPATSDLVLASLAHAAGGARRYPTAR